MRPLIIGWSDVKVMTPFFRRDQTFTKFGYAFLTTKIYRKNKLLVNNASLCCYEISVLKILL